MGVGDFIPHTWADEVLETYRRELSSANAAVLAAEIDEDIYEAAMASHIKATLPRIGDKVLINVKLPERLLGREWYYVGDFNNTDLECLVICEPFNTYKVIPSEMQVVELECYKTCARLRALYEEKYPAVLADIK
jgi:hypothetical protein